MTEICNECGKSVALGSGRFVNRVPDFDDVETRRQMGKPFPEGAFMCAECDAKIRKVVTFEPPRCPYCEANLFRVAETTYETYTFNPEKGVYKEDGETKITCLDCGADLYDVFPNGVCNYSAKEQEAKAQ